MSIRSLVELNHDYGPGRTAEGRQAWLEAMARFHGGGDGNDLPPGVTLKHQRHHSYAEPTADGLLVAKLAGVIAPLLLGKQHLDAAGQPLIGRATRKKAVALAAAVVDALRSDAP